QRAQDLEQEVLNSRQELEREREERHLGEQHFESQQRLQLAKQAHEFTSRVTHEMREAKYCLTEGAPNIEMAVNRLDQISKWLEQRVNS
ncbi:MAG: hypothetical protein JSS02_23040, partial [Planctomycetes bacterium]|nr:hypothetical protein [Planctomycetota bacterium]